MDSVVLYGPGGASPLQLGSWIAADPGPDFGAADLVSAVVTKNPWSEGALQLETGTLRKMKFPMIVPSHSSWGGLLAAESLLRRNAVPGGYVDVQPDGVASSESIRFDILSGHWSPDYDVYHQRVSRRRGSLELSTKTWGYWPTTMILASAASVGLPGSLAVSGASVIGDVPPLLELSIQATTPTSFETFYGSYVHDVLAWSLSALASFKSFWPAASLAVIGAASLYTDGMAPGSQGLAVVGTSNSWVKLANIAITSALEPAYRGAHRVFAWMALGPSQAQALQVAADTVAGSFTSNVPYPPAAPAAATVAPVFGSSAIAVPTGYQLVDLGIVEIPAVGSGNPQAVELRIWTKMNIVPGYIATPLVLLGGVALLPQPVSGYMPQGWHAPTVGATNGLPARLAVDGINAEARLESQAADLASHMALSPAGGYRGPVSARVLPSTVQLDLVSAGRKLGLEVGHVHDWTNEPSDRMWYYRIPGIGSHLIPFAPIGVNTASWGATGAIPSAASIGAPGPLNQPMMFLGGTGFAVSSQVFLGASDWTLLVWASRASLIPSTLTAAAIGTGASHRGIGIGLGTSMFAHWYGLGSTLHGSGFASPLDASYHLLGLTYNRASQLTAMYYDGSYLGAFAASPMIAATTSFTLGRSASGAVHHWIGGVGEALFLPAKQLPQDRIYQMWQAGVSPTNTPSAPMIREGNDFAAVSVRYRPQFQFLKGI